MYISFSIPSVIVILFAFCESKNSIDLKSLLNKQAIIRLVVQFILMPIEDIILFRFLISENIVCFFLIDFFFFD